MRHERVETCGAGPFCGYHRIMQQALTSPVFRSIAVGGVLLVLAISQMGATKSTTNGRVMVLHARAEAGAVYLTAWLYGPVPVPFEGEELVPLTFTTRASVSDGCRWQATETLVPVGPTRYAYRYDETLLDCEPGATPYRKTPRTGCVTVERR
jgi:hypothetical protein